MGYGQLEISEVSDRENPLIQVLHESILPDAGPAARQALASALAGGHDLLRLIAHIEGNPAGFLVGRGEDDGMFEIVACGMLLDYRRQGSGQRMLNQAEAFARARNYTRIEMTVPEDAAAMHALAARSGWQPQEAAASPVTYVKRLV